MTYKIIFTDIDGTLLNKDRRLSPLTKSVFHQLQKEIPIILISSRMPQAMIHLQQELKIDHLPLICYNGGLILVDGKEISSTEVPLSTLQELQTFNNEVNCHLSLYHRREWYVPEIDKWAQREENNTLVTPKVLAPEEVISKWQKETRGAHKIMCMGEEQKINKIEDFLFRNFKDQLHLYRSKETYLEIANKEVSKLTAVDILLEHYGLRREEAIAFGDNYNDFEMLKTVGMGIAVGNAKPPVLGIARQITDHGKQDGVAKSLQNIFDLS